MLPYTKEIYEVFSAIGDPKRAKAQSAYLRNQFDFFGMTSPVRREAQKEILRKEFLPPKSELHLLVRDMWNQPQREFHYLAQELAFKYARNFDKNEIQLFEHMATHHSWWDTIDYISPKLMASYFKKFPGQIKPYTQKWNRGKNIWLRRCAIIFQLHYKDKINPELLEEIITPNLGSKEFFINKAIGWMLRNYSRANPAWVVDFVERYPLNNLSKREALRIIS